MLIYTSDAYPIELPERHRFPMAKYGLIREQLIHEGIHPAEGFVTPSFIPDEVIHLVHHPSYWQRFKELELDAKHFRKIGFPPSWSLVKRSISSASATVQATEQALDHGLGLSTSGGTHHAYAGHGEGFCVLNDVAISARYALAQGRVQRVLVIDLDVHQGNGTAAIFAGDDRVLTFSMHCGANYPLHKERSDVDIALAPGTADEAYLAQLQAALPVLIERQRPDLAFYVAGADVLASDQLGKLSLSREGCRQRDRFVMEQLSRHHIPAVVVMGGGYSPHLPELVSVHKTTLELALHAYT